MCRTTYILRANPCEVQKLNDILIDYEIARFFNKDDQVKRIPKSLAECILTGDFAYYINGSASGFNYINAYYIQ